MADPLGPYPDEVFIHRYISPIHGHVEYDVILPGEINEALEDGDIVGMYRWSTSYHATVKHEVTLDPWVAGEPEEKVPF